IFEFVDGDCDIVIAQGGVVPGLSDIGFDIPALDPEPVAEPSEPDLSSLLALTEEEVAEPLAEVEVPAAIEASPQAFAPEPAAAPVGVQDEFEEAPALSFAALAEEIKPTPPP